VAAILNRIAATVVSWELISSNRADGEFILGANSSFTKVDAMLSRLPALAMIVAVCCSAAANADEPNTLTEKEKTDGWRLLFDGQTTKGWRAYQSKEMTKNWQAIDGALVRVKGGEGGKGAGGGDDIVTTEDFENFELSLEWKIVSGGNSGVLYHVSEEPSTAWHYAPEVQLLDNKPHPTRDKRQLAGACYDLYAPSKDATKPVGEWNELRIKVDHNQVTHWLNGEKVTEYEIGSQDWKDRVAKSKFKEIPKFGTFTKGPICLQDHSDRIEFRSIKVRKL
jgi:cytochrome c